LSASFARVREWQVVVTTGCVGYVSELGKRELIMLLILFIVLLVAWLLGWGLFHVAGGLIHLLLILAIIALIVHFVRRRRA